CASRRRSGQPRVRFGGEVRGSRPRACRARAALHGRRQARPRMFGGGPLGGTSGAGGDIRWQTFMKHKLEIAKGSRKRTGPFAPIEKAIDAIRSGGMVIVVDDPDRENEGDLTIAAEKITPEAINFMARYGRGLICMSMTPERVRARADARV